jgi:hypothetical protein
MPRAPKSENRPGDVIGAAPANADMMRRLQSRARIGVKRVVDFRRKWANKSDRAIDAALNHFWVWGKQINKSATGMQKHKEKPHN